MFLEPIPAILRIISPSLPFLSTKTILPRSFSFDAICTALVAFIRGDVNTGVDIILILLKNSEPSVIHDILDLVPISLPVTCISSGIILRIISYLAISPANQCVSAPILPSIHLPSAFFLYPIN